jgi:tetratricopeptide (TPR) repeat protein
LPLLLLGSDNLARPLRALGREVIVCASQTEADIIFPDPDPEWAVLEKTLRQRGISPSALAAVIVTDHIGSRTLPTGLWGAPPLTLFYGVDSPLNGFWQYAFAGLFDIACLDQAPAAAALSAAHPQSFWLPVGIDPALYQGQPSAAPTPGACFVGVVDDNIRPKRSAVLDRVREFMPLEVRGGRREHWFPTAAAAKLYQQYTITVNENLFAGVTTRPLEVMAAGGCLLSEAAPGQMDIFFKHREHLCYFTPDTLKPMLEELAGNSEMQRRLRARGREIVMEQHSLKRRAQTLLDKLSGFGKRPQDPLAVLPREGEALLMAGLRWARGDRRRLLRARGRLRVAASNSPAAKVCWLLGVSEVSLRQWDNAIESIYQAYELEEDGHKKRMLALNLGLAFHAGQQESKAKRLWRRELKLKGQPGQAAFHYRAAEILADAGHGICPGFSRGQLWPGVWTALEHLLAARKLCAASRELGPILMALGKLLLRSQAPNQAYEVFSQALAASAPDRDLPELCAQAARLGYIYE